MKVGHFVVGLVLLSGVSLAEGTSLPRYLSPTLVKQARDSAVKETVESPKVTVKETKVEILKSKPKIEKELSLSEKILQDAKVASSLVNHILKLNSSVDPSLVYEIAWYTARFSRQYPIDPHVMIGMMEKESDFNPTCTGSAGERGLCQRLVNGTYKVKQNILDGVLDLRGAIQEGGGDVRKGLAIYNGGPRNPQFRYADSVLKMSKF